MLHVLSVKITEHLHFYVPNLSIFAQIAMCMSEYYDLKSTISTIFNVVLYTNEESFFSRDG